jgi:hypothetical protein
MSSWPSAGRDAAWRSFAGGDGTAEPSNANLPSPYGLLYGYGQF